MNGIMERQIEDSANGNVCTCGCRLCGMGQHCSSCNYSLVRVLTGLVENAPEEDA